MQFHHLEIWVQDRYSLVSTSPLDAHSLSSVPFSRAGLHCVSTFFRMQLGMNFMQNILSAIPHGSTFLLTSNRTLGMNFTPNILSAIPHRCTFLMTSRRTLGMNVTRNILSAIARRSTFLMTRSRMLPNMFWHYS